MTKVQSVSRPCFRSEDDELMTAEGRLAENQDGPRSVERAHGGRDFRDARPRLISSHQSVCWNKRALWDLPERHLLHPYLRSVRALPHQGD